MPVTIERLSSNINVVDRPGQIGDEQVIERLVAMVLSRLNGQAEASERARQESEVRDRMSEHD